MRKQFEWLWENMDAPFRRRHVIALCVCAFTCLLLLANPALSRRLIDGGYAPDTPAILIYKATWPEEEAYGCKVSELAQTAAEHNIRKTALVLVGDVLAKSGYAKSRLYAADFSTEFRSAK